MMSKKPLFVANTCFEFAGIIISSFLQDSIAAFVFILISLRYWNVLTYYHIVVQQFSKFSHNLIVQEHLFMIRME